LETGGDDITLQTDTGNIELKGIVEIESGKKIVDSGATKVLFGDSIGITGSIDLTGTVDGVDISVFKSSFDTLEGKTLVSGSSQVSFTSITDVPSELVSGSVLRTLNGTGVFSGSSQVSFNGITDKPTLVSGSDQLSGSLVTSNTTQNITGTKTFQDIIVNGTGSFAYIQSVTGSAKVIGDSFVVVNNDTPNQRYGGLAVYDSGSTNTTASLFYDGQLNDWNYEYFEGGNVDFGVLMFGPEYNTKGTPTYLTNNRIPKANGGHHFNDSNITDDGTTITIGSNSVVSGNLSVSGIINGVISGSSQVSYPSLSNIPSGIISGSSQVSFNSIIDKPSLISGSSQVSYSGLSNIPSGIVSGSSQVDYNSIQNKPTIPTNNNQLTNGAGYLTSLPSHTHDDRYYTESESDSRFAPISHTHSYVPLSGGTLSGNINWGATDQGLTWAMNTDGAYIKFYNTGDEDTNSRLEYATSDNGDEYHRFMVSGVERMKITAGGITATGYNKSNWDTAYGWGNHASAGYLTSAETQTISGRKTFTDAVVLKGQANNYDGASGGRTAYWGYDDKVALALEPAADNGAVAIFFKSIGNAPSDFAYIAYDEDYGEAGVTAGENGALILGCENDGQGSSDHVRVKSRLVVEGDMSSSDPTKIFQVKSSNTTSDLFYVNNSGNYDFAGSDLSDRTLKENIVDIESGLDKIIQLKPKKYNFISNPDITKGGFIAQEVEEVIPDAINGEEGNKGLDYKSILAHAVKAIQEQQTQIEELKAEIELLKNQ